MEGTARFRETPPIVLGQSSDKKFRTWALAKGDESVVLERDKPGTHTVELGVARSMKRVVSKSFGNWENHPVQSDQLLVGWTQDELDGDPAGASSSQLAVQFDTSLLSAVEGTVVDQAVLVYDEVQATGCHAIGQGGVEIVPGGTCWTSGGGGAEDKPNGCVVVRVPSTDWYTNPPKREFPYITSGRPKVNRLSANEWDVTEPFTWQIGQPGAMPLTPPGSPGPIPGFGFLLTGALTIDNLEAEDNTCCLSELSNIRLRTTYTVPEGEFNPPG